MDRYSLRYLFIPALVGFSALASAVQQCPPNAVYCSSFEDSSWKKGLPRSVCMGNPPGSQKWFPSYFNKAYSGDRNPLEAKSGKHSLAFQNNFDKHGPAPYSFAIEPKKKQSDSMYLRWYLKYEPGFEFATFTGTGEVKSAGLGFSDNHCGLHTGGPFPDGFNHYSVTLEMTSLGWQKPNQAKPHLYVYHTRQMTRYGDDMQQNQGNDIIFEGGRWYKVQMMLKANQYPACDGEVKLWVDDQLRAHHKGICFRADNSKKINQMSLSAWFGGDAPSPRTQYQYIDDVIASPTKIK